MMNEHETGPGKGNETAGDPTAVALPTTSPAAAPGSQQGPWRDWVVRSDSGPTAAKGATPNAAVFDGAVFNRPVDNPAAIIAAGGEIAPGASGADEHSAAVSRWRNQSSMRNKKAKRPFWVELPILIVVAFALTFLIQTFVAKVYYVPSGSMEQTLHGVASGGDRILASKIVYDFRDPKQGDVVVFKGPDTWTPELEGNVGPTSWVGRVMASVGSVVGIAPPDEKDFVKRVVAVGGQTVACCDAKGNITVDGRSLDEPYIYEPIPFEPGVSDCSTGAIDDQHFGSLRCFVPFKVPEGELWVMGDHRSYSSDSSYECQGLKAALAASYKQTTGETGCARPIPVDDVIGKAVFIVMPPSRWRTIGNPDIDPSAMAVASGPTAALPVAGGLLLTVGLRGSLAMVPSRRRRRRDAKAARRSATCPGGRRRT